LQKSFVHEQVETVSAAGKSTQNQEEETVMMADPTDTISFAEDELEKFVVNDQETPVIDNTSELRRLSASLLKTDVSSEEHAENKDVVDVTSELTAISKDPTLDCAVDVESDTKDIISNCDRNELNNAPPSETIVSSDDIYCSDADKGLSNIENPAESNASQPSVEDERTEQAIEDVLVFESSEVGGDTDVTLSAERIKNAKNDNDSDTVVNKSLAISNDAVDVKESDTHHSSIQPNITVQNAKSQLK